MTSESAESVENGSDSSQDEVSREGYDQLDGDSLEVEIQNLPEGVGFSDPGLDPYGMTTDVGAIEDRALIDVQDENAEPLEVVEFDPACWSTPVLFYPDGRATNTKLVLTSQEGYEVDINIRGLTGAVRMGDLRRVEVATWEEEIPAQPIP